MLRNRELGQKMPELISQIAQEIQESIAVKVELARGSAQQIAGAAKLIVAALQAGGKAIAFGNGGSAADAQHFAAELVGRYRMDRRALAAMALTTDSSALTAIANDYGFEQVFSRQLEAIGKSGDVVVAFSTSGNSANVLRALECARDRSMTRIGLSGKSGGEMLGMVDVCVCVPSDATPRIQEAHALISHILCGAVETEISTDLHIGRDLLERKFATNRP
jgi:D-sedoheptulose 7-phosphate isomerase